MYVDIVSSTHDYIVTGNEFMGPMGGVIDSWKHFTYNGKIGI